MAVVALPGGTYLPTPWWFLATEGLGTAEIFLDGVNDKFGFILQVPKSGTLDTFECLLTIWNNPDNGLRFSFQTVDPATGLPDGTQDQYRDLTGTLASGWTVPGAITSDGTDTGSKRTVVAGEVIACVVEFVSYVAADEIGVHTLSASAQAALPYCANGATGAYSKYQNLPIIALKYADGTYATMRELAWPITAMTARGTNAGTTPDERGLRFTVPAAFTCDGAWVRMDADGPVDLLLYDATDTILASGAVDPDIRIHGNPVAVTVAWDPVTLVADAVYRLAFRPTSGTSIVTYDVTLPSAARQACLPGGTSWYATERTDAGAWTDTDTIRPIAGISLAGVETSGGGGGGLSWAPISVVAAAGASLIRAVASGMAAGRG